MIQLKDVDFSFEGPFGTFDQNQLQRVLRHWGHTRASLTDVRSQNRRR